MHCKENAVHDTLYKIHCTEHTYRIKITENTVQNTLYKEHFLQMLYSKLFIIHCTIYNCLYIAHFIPHSFKCTLYTVKCTYCT